MTACQKAPVAVIGGGVSGMAAAHYLLEQGLRVDLYEAGAQLGGRVCIDNLNGEEICFGGKNIGFQYTEFRRFLTKYGNPQLEYFGINSARIENNKIRVFNSRRKMKSLLTLWQGANPSDLFKLKACLKAVKSDRQNGDLSAPYFYKLAEIDGVRLTSYFSSKFSNAFLRALTVRMNGAEPHEIALENFGANLQMVQDEYEQVSTSLSSVFQAFAQAKTLSVYLNSPVQDIKRSGDGYSLKRQGEKIFYQNVIVALPASRAADLLNNGFSKLSSTLRTPRYFPVAVIVADYAQNVFTQDIRALTFGPESPLSNIGAYGIHQLNRVRYTFSGKVTRDILHDRVDDRDLLEMGEAAARPFFNLSHNPCRAFKLKYWEEGLCGYTVKETIFQTELNDHLEKLPGLFLTGDYRKGASMENCFRAAKAAVQSFLSQNQGRLMKA